MLTKQMRDLERLATMQEEEFRRTNPDYQPMFPAGWADDKNWPDVTYDYNSFRKTQIQIDDHMERMAGCYDTE
jgi:hypothetical protein